MNLIANAIRAAKVGAKTVSKNQPFYSAADKAALALARTKGTGKEFMTEVKKTKGVKPTEIQHRKLEQIEEMPKMTKEQFLAELEKRPPADVSENVLEPVTDKLLDDIAEEMFPGRMDYTTYDDLKPHQKMQVDEAVTARATSYDKYQIPKGENYREILLQLPSFTGEERLMYLDAKKRHGGLHPELAREYERLKSEKESFQPEYLSRHWEGNPNVLAHMRVSDRTTPEGKKVLHVEEIQSDWHQEGRQKGYKEKYAPKTKEVTGRTMSVADLINEYGDEGKKWLDVQNSINQDLNLPFFDESTKVNVLYHNGEPQIVSEASKKPLNEMIESQQRAIEKMQRESEMMHSNSQKNKVPDAPFKKNWHELAMKRLINYAAENGYDSVAITPGAEQAKRYDLSKHIETVSYIPSEGRLIAKDHQGKVVLDKTYTKPEDLPEYIGKDLAQKLLETEPTNVMHKSSDLNAFAEPKQIHVLAGQDIQVGGEGMLGFYDKILPDYLNQFGKPYGSQVELGGFKIKGDPSMRGEASERLGLAGQRFDEMTPEEIEAFNAKLDEANAVPLHNFPITPQMREEVTQRGLPMYQQIGIPLGAGTAGTNVEIPQPAEEPVEEPAYAMGGAVDDTTPDMSDSGQFLQGSAFKRGGKVHIADNPDVMFMELQDRMFKRK